jgi:crossover junction endodeoxyribonuclease RuvC
MIVLGIDPGTAITGFGIIEELPDQSLKVRDCGVIRTKPSSSDWDRLRLLFEQINTIISLHQPDCAAVEKLYFQQNVTTALSVGQARGVILLAMALNNIQVSEYSPLEVKQSVAGYGRADKQQIQRMVATLLLMEETPSPDDMADALAVGICHINSYKLRNLASQSDRNE